MGEFGRLLSLHCNQCRYIRNILFTLSTGNSFVAVSRPVHSHHLICLHVILYIQKIEVSIGVLFRS